jgi:hypothetical protein
VTINVTNQAPVANEDSYRIPHDRALTTSAGAWDSPGLLDNDSDPDNDALTVISHTDPSHGALALSADGTFTYTPAAGFTGTDSFTYTVSDGVGTAVATATVEVTEETPPDESSEDPDLSAPPALPPDVPQEILDLVNAFRSTLTESPADSSGSASSDGNAGPVTEEGSTPEPSGFDGDVPTQTGPATAPVVQITAGGYRRHYTRTGNNSDAEFFLDVTIDSTFGVDTSSGESIPTETGTVTYTVWLKEQGSDVFNETGTVVPFSEPLAGDLGAPRCFGL